MNKEHLKFILLLSTHLFVPAYQTSEPTTERTAPYTKFSTSISTGFHVHTTSPSTTALTGKLTDQLSITKLDRFKHYIHAVTVCHLKRPDRQ